MGMNKTLDTFQCEWYELQQKGLIKEDYATDVPDVYTQNGHLETEVRLELIADHIIKTN